MAYSFMTIQKVKNEQVLYKKYLHNFRKMPVANADPEMKKYNEEIKKMYGLSYNDYYKDKIANSPYYKTHKVRKNAVLALEVVMTFSRSAFENIDLEEWKKTNLEWLEREFNCDNSNNVISVVFHADEPGNVHIHALVIPMDEKGQLNASKYTDGREKMVGLQNSYGELMKKKHNLDRGLHNSKAKHEDIKRFYTCLNTEIGKKLPEPLKDEKFEDYYERINWFYDESNLQNLYEIKQMERKIDEYRTEIYNLRKENAKNTSYINDLNNKLDKINKKRKIPYKDIGQAIENTEIWDRVIRNLYENEDKEYSKKAFENILDSIMKQTQKELKTINDERLDLLFDKRNRNREIAKYNNVEINI